MRNVIIEVSKKVNGKYEKQGEVAITVPLIEDVAATAASAKITGEEDGLPVYDTDIANWLQSAMLAYVKANARNKLQPGTAAVKDGLKIPTNWEELCAEGTRDGSALAAVREARVLFIAWIAKQGKSEAAQATITTLFSNKAALQLQSAANKAKMAKYVADFAESLSEEQLDQISKPIENVLAACESGDAEDF